MTGEMARLSNRHELVRKVRYLIRPLLVVYPWDLVAQEAALMVGQMEDQGLVMALAMFRASQGKVATMIQDRDRHLLFHLRAETPALSLF